MPYDKLIDSAKLDAAMNASADAIRAKTGGTADIPWDESTGFANAISGITTSGKYQSKAATPSTSEQTIKPDSGYDALSQVTVNAMPTATQATPSISVSSAGLITASATQTAGYVAKGTKSATKQLTVQAAKTVTPSTSDQTAVASGRYTTGAVTVKGDSNLKAANIASGVSIFGVTGTLKSGNVASGEVTISYSNRYKITISGLGFRPSNLVLMLDGYYTGIVLSETMTSSDISSLAKTTIGVIAGEYNLAQWIAGSTLVAVNHTNDGPVTVTFSSGGFTVDCGNGGTCLFPTYSTYRYVAW